MSKQQSGKSSRTEPLVSDEHGPLHHAPRKPDGEIDWSAMWALSHEFWHTKSFDCRNCNHYISRHYAGICIDCRHECLLSLDFAGLEGRVIAANTASLK